MACALELYVRALWGERAAAPVLEAASPSGTNSTRPFADLRGLHIPARFPMYGPGRQRAARFAAAAHLGAHLRFGQGRFRRGGLRPIQVVLVSLFEDARVERLAARELPGLGRLWASFHRAAPADHPTFPSLCARISHALLDEQYRDPHPLVQKALALFSEVDRADAEGCRRMGSLLGNDVGQIRLPFDARVYEVEPPYRDDHRLLWEEQGDDPAPALEELPEEAVEQRARTTPSGGGGTDREGQRGRARPVPGLLPLADPDQQTSAAMLASYPEWDYRIGVARPGWCTVREPPAPRRAPAETALAASGDPAAGLPASPLARQMARLARTLRLERLARRRRVVDGAEVDLDAAIEVAVEARRGGAPDPRVYARLERHRLEMAVLLLLDLSASTGTLAGDEIRPGATVLDLEREAALLVGDLLAKSGEPFAIHGFSSSGRAQVEYRRLKDLDGQWDAGARARLHELEPQLSTRMGAALRHAGRYLRQIQRERRLILMLTDGEPADIDAPDPAYLLHDARHAVAALRRDGIHVFAVNLDPAGDLYARRIFGPGGYSTVDRLSRLPATLPYLYARLAR